MMEQDNPKIGLNGSWFTAALRGLRGSLFPTPMLSVLLQSPLSGLRESVLLRAITIPTALTLRLPLRTESLQPLRMKGF